MSFCPLPVTTRELAWPALLSAVPPTHWIVNAVLPLSHCLHHQIFSLGGVISTVHKHVRHQTNNCTSSSLFPHYCPEKPQITFLSQPTSAECLPSNYSSWSQMSAMAVTACPVCAEVSSNSPLPGYFLILVSPAVLPLPDPCS